MGSKSAIGIGNGICFKQVRDKGGGSYIDPLVRDSIVGLWKSDQNTNESPTRNIIKNTIKGKGGDLELLNFGYKLNSGYGGYIEDFSLFTLSNRFEYSEISNTKVTITAVLNNSTGIYHAVTEEESALYWNTFKIKVSGSTDDVYISYNTINKSIRLYNGINTVVVPNELSWHSFTASATNVSCNITLEFVPEYEGALVTDGKDDMIVSQNTVQEMLGGSKEITVVSMIHQIGLNSTHDKAFTNYIEATNATTKYVRSQSKTAGKTGIYGYTYNGATQLLINNILGDKNDYEKLLANATNILSESSIFRVASGSSSTDTLSQVAWYWTIIANKVLTTDQINQVISYFNLDKYVKPDVYYDVKKQGLSNDTPEADWYLKDFSGNGHDMQLYNYAKKGNSGVGKYEEDFTSWSKTSSLNLTSSGFTIKSVNDFNNANWILWSYLNTSPKSFKIRVNGSPNNSLLIYRYQKDGSTIAENIVLNKDGVYELSASIYVQNGNGFRIDTMDKSDLEKYIGLSVEQIPDYEGALVSDGKDDYGYADNLPIFKDYTVAIDRAWINLVGARSECLSTKNSDPDWGAFNFELSESIGRSTFSFGNTNQVSIDVDRKISYQSKYSYNGAAIAAGNIVDGKDLFLFRSRSAFPYYAEAAIWSYLLFPYSLSEFLLERQLKKYKLGTLYPDMVEFRPIITGNIPYDAIEISQGSTVLYNKSINKTGIYLQEGSTVRVYIQPSGIDEVSKITINGIEYTDLPINPNGFYYADFPITKSPQKISYVIDEYIRFEDIVQPYPAIVNIPKVDGGYYTYGDKIPLGYRFRRESAINLLPELYSLSDIFLNGELCNVGAEIVISKSMVFTANKIWLLDTTEPHAIYSPQKLNIPNSSLKILGYVPDLTGKGNHGKLNNFAYTEDSGVAADGSVKFDGTDDHITIPTLAHGGKCVMMKVNWSNYGMLYDQRPSGGYNTFGIYTGENPPAYSARNNGSTYIDGILNTNIIPSNLAGITHNITAVNDTATDNSTTYPILGRSFANATFSDMSLYEFMLFPEIPSEDEIKKLNDVMGIEGGYIESPNYYWDAYGKKNTDTDRNLIADQVSKDVANALEVKNVAYNSESGYTDNNGLLLDGVEDHAVNTVIPAVTDFTVIAKREWLGDYQPSAAFVTKGTSNTYTKAAFMMEYKSSASIQIGSFGILNSGQNMPDLITYMTPIDYNKAELSKGTAIDENGLIMGKYSNTYYWKGVFYKLMFYTKTIDQLSINMLKNLFERDELIDVTNPIFKKEEL